ncbi:MAG: DUF4349 domain-containing protein [Clostridiales bacterium]|nr:DUF4349 domain-containing protein [Clostridiales bacterium]
MNNDTIYDAVSGIDEKYITESNDIPNVRRSFKKAGRKRKKIIAVICCCCLVVFTALPIAISGLTAVKYDVAPATASYTATKNTSYEYDYARSEQKAGYGFTEDIAADGAMYDAKSSESETKTATSGEKLVYRCSMRLETLKYAETVKAVRANLKKYGGFVQYEEEINNDNVWYYTDGSAGKGLMTLMFTARVPTENYEAFISSVEGSGKVMSKESSVDNISKQYHDKEAVISSLEQQEKRLQEMMSKAKTIEEMISVEKRLTEVQTELNRYRTELASMDTDVEYSTVDLNISEVREYSPLDNDEINGGFVSRLINTVKRSWRVFRGGMESFIFALVYIIPFAALIAVIVVVTVVIVKKKRRTKIKKSFDKAESEDINNET